VAATACPEWPFACVTPAQLACERRAQGQHRAGRTGWTKVELMLHQDPRFESLIYFSCGKLACQHNPTCMAIFGISFSEFYSYMLLHGVIYLGAVSWIPPIKALPKLISTQLELHTHLPKHTSKRFSSS
jgi:hypothetical protein